MQGESHLSGFIPGADLKVRMKALTVVHSSDLHIAADRATGAFHPLCRVLATATGLRADLLLLAGDIFDHNRVPVAMVDGVSSLLAEAGLPVVILPGNHDCLTAGSVYERGGIADVPNVRISGTDGEQAFRFPELDLEVWGRAHAEYRNMAPLRDPPPRSALRRIVMAHGHWLRDEGDRHRGWLLTSEEIAAADADYVALGHWPQAQRAGNDSVPAYYCGSPDLAGTVNVVRFVEDAAAADVRRAPLMRKVPP